MAMARNGGFEGCWPCDLSILAGIADLSALAFAVPQPNERRVIGASEVPN